MSQLNGVVIGLGGQSIGDHIPALLANEDVTIVGVMDVNLMAVADFRSTFPVLAQVPSFASLSEMLDQVRPDFAVVAVPHHLYVPIVVELCRRNIPFLKEKPLARSLEEAEQLRQLPNFDQCAFVATQRRFSGLYSMAWQGLARIGTPYLFTGEYKLNIADPHTGWRGQRELAGGGCLIDMGYHIVDQLTWWFGLPSSIHANVSALAVPNAAYTAEDSATVSFRYSSGLHGTLTISRRAGAKKEGYEVYGTDGHIIGSKKGADIYGKDGEILQELGPDEEDMIAAQLRFFLARVQDNRSFEDTLEDHMRNMQFIDRCYKTALVNG